MTSKERVLAAAKGQKVDCVPASFTMHFGPQFKHGDPAVMMHLDYLKRTGVDILNIKNENTYRCDTRINTAKDFKHVKPMSVKSKDIQDQLYIIKTLADKVGDTTSLTLTTFSMVPCILNAMFTHIRDMDLPDGNLNMGGIYETDGFKIPMFLREEPEIVGAAFKVIGESLAEHCQAYAEAGLDSLYYSVMACGENFMTRAEYEKYIEPYDLAALKASEGIVKFNILHVCKSYADMTRFTDYPVEVVNWPAFLEGCPDLDEGKKIIGPNRTVMGGFDDRSGPLYEGDFNDLANATKKIIDHMGTHRFILSADCSIEPWYSYDRIRCIVDTCHEYSAGK